MPTEADLPNLCLMAMTNPGTCRVADGSGNPQGYAKPDSGASPHHRWETSHRRGSAGPPVLPERPASDSRQSMRRQRGTLVPVCSHPQYEQPLCLQIQNQPHKKEAQREQSGDKQRGPRPRSGIRPSGETQSRQPWKERVHGPYGGPRHDDCQDGEQSHSTGPICGELAGS